MNKEEIKTIGRIHEEISNIKDSLRNIYMGACSNLCSEICDHYRNSLAHFETLKEDVVMGWHCKCCAHDYRITRLAKK